MPAFSIFGIGNGWLGCFNNKLSAGLPKISDNSDCSVFLRNCKWWEYRSPFRGIVFFKDSNVHQSYNFLALLQFLFHWSRNRVSTRMNWFTIRIHQLETNWFSVPCWILLMFHQTDSWCSYFWSSVLSWCCSSTWMFSHVLMTSSKLAGLYSASRILVAREYSSLIVCGSFALI
jgi:hypothetical protein